MVFKNQKIIGALAEPENSLVHVVVRDNRTYGGIDLEEVKTMSLAEEKGAWKLLMPAKTKAMGRQLRKIIERLHGMKQ